MKIKLLRKLRKKAKKAYWLETDFDKTSYKLKSNDTITGKPRTVLCCINTLEEALEVLYSYRRIYIEFEINKMQVQRNYYKLNY